MPDRSPAIATIHQIVPAHSGWWMDTRMRDAGDIRITYPVAVWALVEDHDGRRSIVGFTADEASSDEPNTPVEPVLFPPDEAFLQYRFEEPG